MRLRVTRTDESHLPEMARIFSARHRRHRAHNPELPECFEDEGFVAAMLRQGFEAYPADSAVALAGDRLVGFLQGRIRSDPLGAPTTFFWPPRSVSMPLAAHAVEPEFTAEGYPALYGYLSPEWVGSGHLNHLVFLPAHDRAALDTWFSLNFGLYWTYAARDTRPLERSGGGGSIRPIGPADAERVLDLLDELYAFHSASPCYMPVPATMAQGIRERNEQALVHPETFHWVAEQRGEIVGVIVVARPKAEEPGIAMAKPENSPYIHLAITEENMRGRGIGTALVDTVLTWARDEGYRYCSLDYHPASVESARFWEHLGFKPVRHGLLRRVDERVVEGARGRDAWTR